ncbi:EAL domain-containing protein [Arthrospira platensis NCB002]|uniref:Two-component response regulator n=1 Tax=Limnospira platensis NIES-46 TaxID=1236695 RepID=A0A5M3T6F9_LIMPL|nr:GGDEF domain-containing response regulator [Arthrospira platensis]MDF2211014.1 EAL domain-containing protein [Arthrospira platensis NCB002]BAI88938.1 two-component response regulator [Arthrospira platensis NIES-39]BDT11344.1 two-component response regulator [Arthrospira platensis NIES-39]GCE94202.1 two-component response regulator [Arthrospira platensis NIES-46]
MDTPKADILVVDDKPENLHLLSEILMMEGYNVRKAVNGKMALMAVKTVPPDLILLDIMMPGMDGYQVCKELKNNQNLAKVPVIFLSALNDVFDKVKAFGSGGVDYITKPFQMEEVLVRVENHLMLKAAEKKILELNTELEARVKERTQQLEMANAKLLEMALHDPLTRLPNRTLFMEQVSGAMNNLKEGNSQGFAVLFMDCDRFKVVNDSLGHTVGDELLIAIGDRIQKILKNNDLLSRLGGDEFAIIVHDVNEIEPVRNLADSILEVMSCPFQIYSREIFINMSIGVVLSNTDYQQPEHLLRDADTAMYRAKALGRGQYHIFDPAMHKEALDLLGLETDLRRALDNQELMAYYQPIINLETGKIYSMEALVRWQHPQRGLVSPGMFIPLAEEMGVITTIGTLMLVEACHQLKHWQEQKLVDEYVSISVNLSVRQFTQADLIATVDDILTESGLNPKCLRLEMTESAIVENTQTARTILTQFRDRHIGLSLDDFGTGYSSLSYLHAFPVDTIKIDKSFVSLLDGTPENLGLIPAIIGISKTLNMVAVAEGIETPEQLAQLRELQCNGGQGYFFSRPLPATQMAELLASHPQW